MGLYHSRFIEALKRGSEDEARQLYSNRKSVRDSIDPNSPLGPTHNENSILHYAALHAMEWLYQDLLTRGGKPDQRNAVARNCLHLVCSQKNRNQARANILQLTIHEGLAGMDVEHVLRERDEEGNTALHLAASAGLRTCVEYLLDNKADPYVTNKKEQTAADCAAECKRSAIATLLETRMVFTVSSYQPTYLPTCTNILIPIPPYLSFDTYTLYLCIYSPTLLHITYTNIPTGIMYAIPTYVHYYPIYLPTNISICLTIIPLYLPNLTYTYLCTYLHV